MRKCSDEVILKGNIGRDFSSVYCALNYLKNYLYPNPDDIVLIRNRSAYGAFKNGWFSDYINVLNHPKNNDVAIAIIIAPTIVALFFSFS